MNKDYIELENGMFMHQKCYDSDWSLCQSCFIKPGHHKGSYDRLYCQKCHNQIVAEENISLHNEYVLDLLERNGFTGLREANIPVSIVAEENMSIIKNDLNFFQKIMVSIAVSIFDFDLSAPLNGVTQDSFKKGYFSRLFTGNKEKECTIEIIENLPEIDFRATLAHEYLHAWMMVNNDIFTYYNNLTTSPPGIEWSSQFHYGDQFTEGFAEIGTYLALNDANTSSIKINYELDQKDEFTYGEGYRIIKVCLDYHGLDSLIYKALNKEPFPCFEQPLLFQNKLNN